ncbi:MAG: HRDC domain-containing protein [Clostridia bacterium]|nr:HRDC domain-containing protein [Clostridia bacterium]
MFNLSYKDDTVLISKEGEYIIYSFDHKSELYNQLASWRLEQARCAGLPAYCIMENNVLQYVVDALPCNLKMLWLIPGLYHKRIEAFGNDIIKIVSDFLSKHNIQNVLYGHKSITISKKNEGFFGYYNLLDYFKKKIDAPSIDKNENNNVIFGDVYIDPKTHTINKTLINNVIDTINKQYIDDSNRTYGINVQKSNKKTTYCDRSNFLMCADIFEVSKTVIVGSVVTLKLNDDIYTFEIVPSVTTYKPTWTGNPNKRIGTEETTTSSADPYRDNTIADSSPLAKAILGKCAGKTFSYKVNNLTFNGTIISIDNSNKKI